MTLHVYFILLPLSLLIGASFQQRNKREPRPICPEGWYSFLNYFKPEFLCYLYVDEEVTWHEANTRCANQGAIMGEPDTNTKNYFVSKIKGAKWDVWLGASDIETEGRWVWNSSGRVVNTSSWSTGQPDAWYDAADCLVQNWDEWWNWPCMWKVPYVCQKPATLYNETEYEYEVYNTTFLD